jgi:hypothetical protein
MNWSRVQYGLQYGSDHKLAILHIAVTIYGTVGSPTTKGFREVRMVLRVNPRDCVNAMTSIGCNIVDCMASIKHGKDVILAGRG